MTILKDEIYQKLAQHLDRLPAGFPSTEHGVEIRILKRMFSPTEAKIACTLNMQLESVQAIAPRLSMQPSELEPILGQMASKGLIFRKNTKKDVLYMAAQFVVGIWEYHVNDLDPDLISDFNLYVSYLARQWKKQKTQQLRVIPISKSVSAETKVMPYDQAETIIRKQSKIVVATCICRKEQRIAGNGCNKPLEACLVFGSGAYYYENNGIGHSITQEDALDLLKQGAQAGLVLQPGNAQKVMNMCLCCGCCCQVLKNVKKFTNPASVLNSSHFALVDENLCVSCGICQERCPMEAISMPSTAQIDPNRCIGCGVCVVSCEAAAIQLKAKPDEQRWIPPSTVFETYFRIAQERGLL